MQNGVTNDKGFGNENFALPVFFTCVETLSSIEDIKIEHFNFFNLYLLSTRILTFLSFSMIRVLRETKLLLQSVESLFKTQPLPQNSSARVLALLLFQVQCSSVRYMLPGRCPLSPYLCADDRQPLCLIAALPVVLCHHDYQSLCSRPILCLSTSETCTRIPRGCRFATSVARFFVGVVSLLHQFLVVYSCFSQWFPPCT